MISVWDPIILPWGFDYKRAGMLKEATGPFGARIHAHWQNRNHLVTSKIEILVEAPAANSVADFEALTLSMAAGLSRDHYMHEISEFAHEAHRRALAGARPYERVWERRGGRTHLVRPYESVAACGRSGLNGPASNSSLTCKGCIREALRHIQRVPDPLEFVVLQPEEIFHSGKVPNKRSVSAAEIETWTTADSLAVLEIITSRRGKSSPLRTCT